ncbi:MAG: hypothetical protein KKB79_00535 [Nanoarchaeota archaeon]|nr:hypothetical protein [Nanoarchaeota archaeon]
MPRKNKGEVNLEALNFKPLLEEAVVCSRLGRTIASFGATLTGREKQNANLVYLLLKGERELPERTPTTASISRETKTKKFGYPESVKWFVEKYPKEAQPLLAKLKETYDKIETAVVYGVQQGKDLSDDYYVKVLVDILQIPQQDAAVMYHGVIKPHIQRMEEKEGLVKLVVK